MAKKDKKHPNIADQAPQNGAPEASSASMVPVSAPQGDANDACKNKKPSKNLPVPNTGGRSVQPSTIPVNFPDIERRNMLGRALALLVVLAVLVASAVIFTLRPAKYDERTNSVNFFYRPEAGQTTVAVNGKVRGEIAGALRYQVYDSTGRICAAIFEQEQEVKLYLIKGKDITCVASAVQDCVLSANGKVLAWRNASNELYYSVIGDENGTFRISGTATDGHYCLSPDGKELFYTSERDGSLQADVYSRTGTNPYQQENKGLLPVAVADDCRYLYYLKDGALYVLPAQTGIPVLCGDQPVLDTIKLNRSCSELMFQNGTETRLFVKGARMLLPDVSVTDSMALIANQRVAVLPQSEGVRYLMDSFCNNYYVMTTGTADKLVYLEKSKDKGVVTHVSFVDGVQYVTVTDKYVFFLLTDKGESASHTNLWRCATGKTEETRTEWDVSDFIPNVDGSRILFTNAEGALYSCVIGAAPVRLCDSILEGKWGVTLDDAFYFYRAEGQLWVSDNGDTPRMVREGVAQVMSDCHTAYFLVDVPQDETTGTVYANNRNRRADTQIAVGVQYMR